MNLTLPMPASIIQWSKAITLLLGLFFLPLSVQGAFRYADQVSTTGGQFNSSYSPTNLINNGFTSPTNIINTQVNYLAAGNNYATASGTTANFDLTFDFNQPMDISALHVWNYVFRNGTGGATSVNSGVNSYALTLFSGANGSGNVITNFSGTLTPAVWNALNAAQTIGFGLTNSGVRSVVLHVNSNHGAASFSGINELAFETHGASAPPVIVSFTASTNLLTAGTVATLNWAVGAVTNLTLDNGLGSVLLQTTNGIGSIQVSPGYGSTSYTLTANGVESSSVSLVRLPDREKVHIYLLIGQSNMQGAGTEFDPVLDAPLTRVLQFGSRDGMESVWTQARHPLTSLTPGGNVIGMGLEFARTMLASNADPDVVICLINHALGSTPIQWWSPGAITTGLGARNYQLYNEATQRVQSATAHGVIKGVLWHQGEYNCNTNNANPSAEPELYAQRLRTLVDNLRNDLGVPGLPFVCGKLVPQWTNGVGAVFFPPTLHRRDIVEAVLEDLRNQRSNTECVSNSALKGREDQVIHFDASSQRKLGGRYAQEMLDLYADPYRLYMGGFYSPAQLANPALVNLLGDNDQDGEPNYMEYAFKTRPNDAASVEHLRGVLYQTNISGNVVSYPAVTFRKRVDTEAPLYAVEVSDDLQTWRSNQPNQSPETITEQPPTLNADGNQTVLVRSAQALSTYLFMRLRITLP